MIKSFVYIVGVEGTSPKAIPRESVSWTRLSVKDSKGVLVSALVCALFDIGAKGENLERRKRVLQS
jgi:hypothetical protein